MSFDLSSIQTGVTMGPPRILIMGVPGIGKTTWAAQAKKAIFIRTEDGTGGLDVSSFPLATKYEQVKDSLKSLYKDEHDFKTLVIDSASGLETLIYKHVCEANHFESIEDFGYGKGYKMAVEEWGRFLRILDALRTHRGMTEILTAHCKIAKHSPPDLEAYSRYYMDLDSKTAEELTRWSDAVLFANYETFTKKEEAGFGNKETKGVGAGKRLMFTEERPSHIAKNRYNLPYEMPLDYAEFKAAVDAFKSSKQPKHQQQKEGGSND